MFRFLLNMFNKKTDKERYNEIVSEMERNIYLKELDLENKKIEAMNEAHVNEVITGSYAISHSSNI